MAEVLLKSQIDKLLAICSCDREQKAGGTWQAIFPA